MNETHGENSLLLFLPPFTPFSKHLILSRRKVFLLSCFLSFIYNDKQDMLEACGVGFFFLCFGYFFWRFVGGWVI
jgi:hypothetical protein